MIRQRIVVAALALSAAGLVGITQYEGFTDKAVIPVPGDVPTLGFGTTEGVKLGDRITPPQALERALRDAGKAESAIRRCVHVPLTQGEYDAYTSLGYNIGAEAFCNSTLVRRLNHEEYAAACAEILKWDKFKGKPLAGLTARRLKERATCEGR